VSRPAPLAGSVAEGLQAAVRRGAMPAASWWIGGPGAITDAGAVGAASPDTPFDLASLTKPLATALLAVLLEQEGLISLDQPLRDLLPEVAGSPVGERTLLELGSHRAGLPAWRPLSAAARTREGMTAAIAGLPLEPPGREVYSDLGYLLLGFTLERAGGRPLDRAFRERIAPAIAPARLGYAGPEDRFPDAAPTEEGNAYERQLAGEAGAGHAWRTRITAGEVHDGNAHALGGVAGHAGLFGTAAAVGELASEILRPRRLGLGDRARARLLIPVAADADRTFGLVLARGSNAARGVLPEGAPGHTGFTGTSLWLLPEREQALVLLTNRVHPGVREEDFQPVRADFHARALRSLP
jgi:CubicO group peptidase (beta-lactamase class C family)